jgi:CheY-like chemotaxis protein
MATIVCVDDDPGVLLLHKTSLENDGHTVLMASDGPTAVTLCQQNRIALVVLDYLMPGMNGGEVAAKLRCQQPELPIVLCSGCVEEVPAQLTALVSYLIPKGDGPRALLSAVDNILRPGARGRDHVKSLARQSTLEDWENTVMLAASEHDPEPRQRRIDLAMHAIGRGVRQMSQSCDQSQEGKAIARPLSSLRDEPTTNKKYG